MMTGTRILLLPSHAHGGSARRQGEAHLPNGVLEVGFFKDAHVAVCARQKPITLLINQILVLEHVGRKGRRRRDAPESEMLQSPLNTWVEDVYHHTANTSFKSQSQGGLQKLIDDLLSLARAVA